MAWPKGLIEIGSSLIAIAPYGGPIGKKIFSAQFSYPMYVLLMNDTKKIYLLCAPLILALVCIIWRYTHVSY